MTLDLTGVSFYVFILILAVVAFNIFIIVRRHSSKYVSPVDRAQMEDAQRERRMAAEAERHRAEAASAAAAAQPSAPEVVIPASYKGYDLAYHYDDVRINSVGLASSYIHPDLGISLAVNGDTIDVLNGKAKIGTLPANRLSGMVRDWNDRGDPYLAFLASYNADGSNVVIALAFYENSLEKYLSRHPDAKLVKLAGKPEEFASPSVGMRCSVDYDYEKEKYFVMSDGIIFGCLPASGVKYASDHDIDPDDLSVIVGSVDYDMDKGRDIISVYIAE